MRSYRTLGVWTKATYQESNYFGSFLWLTTLFKYSSFLDMLHILQATLEMKNAPTHNDILTLLKLIHSTSG